MLHPELSPSMNHSSHVTFGSGAADGHWLSRLLALVTHSARVRNSRLLADSAATTGMQPRPQLVLAMAP